MLKRGTSNVFGQELQAELKAWEKSIEASYKQEGLAQLASLQIDDLYPLDKETGKPKKGARAISKYRLAAMKKDNSNFLVTDANLTYIWEIEQLPIPSIMGNKVSIGEFSSKIDSFTLLDAFSVWLANTTHTITSAPDILTGKVKNETYYSYNKDNIEYYGSSDTAFTELNANVNAIRIKKTGHTSTAMIMYKFLVACGYAEEYKIFATNYQIGHIDSQAHMKVIITRAAKDSSAYSGGLIDKLIQLLKYIDLGSSSLTPRHSGAIAAINKNSQNGRATVDLEIQATGFANEFSTAKNPLTNQGSADLSHALNIVAILKNLGSTATKVPVGEQPIELRNLKATTEAIASNLEMLHRNFQKNKEAIKFTLDKFSRAPEMALFLLDLESSDSMRTFIKKSVIHSIDPKSVKPIFNADLKSVPILKLDNSSSEKLIQTNKKLAKDIKQQLTKAKTAISKAKSVEDTIKRNKPRHSGANFQVPFTQRISYSLVNLQQLINDSLQHVISANMGSGGQNRVLNYQTGRFAASAKVERMSQSREGMITAFYSYMKNPYQTFEPGYAQGSPKTRDPKLLIAKSIREIAATKVGNRLRAVSI